MPPLGERALRIGVDQHNRSIAGRGGADGEMRGDRRLAGASLLARNGDDVHSGEPAAALLGRFPVHHRQRIDLVHRRRRGLLGPFAVGPRQRIGFLQRLLRRLLGPFAIGRRRQISLRHCFRRRLAAVGRRRSGLLHRRRQRLLGRATVGLRQRIAIGVRWRIGRARRRRRRLAGHAAGGARPRERGVRQAAIGVEDDQLTVGPGRKGVALGQQLGGRWTLATAGYRELLAAQAAAVIRSTVGARRSIVRIHRLCGKGFDRNLVGGRQRIGLIRRLRDSLAARSTVGPEPAQQPSEPLIC